MTATPREPTREEAALQAMGPDALMNAQGEEFSAGPANMEIYRRLKERDALLAQAPKVWTAEEWRKDSPNGEYRVGNIHEDGGMLWSLFYRKENILESFVGYTHLYGPMDEQEGPDRIAPPPPEEKGG